MKSCSNQAGNMCHIDHQNRADLVRNLTETLKINCSAVRTCTGYDQFRLTLQCELFDLVIVDKAIFIDSVRNTVEIFPGEIDRTAMGQMSALTRLIPIKVSPGCRNAKKTAVLAWAPEWGCTFA